ncbi:MAG: fused MFS/spermidine synthase [Thermoanaerobaculia bacterium]|nr:fused MFS/spermidine synthase [Thermoanaerobaculia bacterium]
MRPSDTRAALLAACFFCSGAASLMAQVVWLRYLSLTFGNTTQAAATLLAVFMGGLGLGALLFGRLADRWRRPLAAYALLEALIALFAIASPALLGAIDQGYVAAYRSLAGSPGLFVAVRVALAAAVLLPPTLLMGGTLPLLLRGATRSDGEVGRRTALFYAINTLGAAAGVAVAGFVTVRLAGLHATLLFAASLNLLAALGAALLSRPLVPAAAAPAESAVRQVAAGPAARPRGPLLALFFAMGLASLGYEVLWTRALVFHLGSSVYAYSLMLCLFLAGLGLGSWLAAPWADRLRSPLAALAAVEAGLALVALAQVPLFARLSDSLVFWSERVEPRSFAAGAAVQLLSLVPLIAPATLLMGLSFPLAVRAFHRELGRLGGEVGAVYGANTLGSIAGSLGTGFLLIPWLGTQNGLLALGATNGLLAALLAAGRLGDAGPARRWRAAAVAVPLACLAAMPLAPADRVILGAGIFRGDRPEDLLHFEEDASTSVTVRRRHDAPEPYLSLELNGVNVAGTSSDLYAVQKMQGHLPLLLAGGARDVAHIGFGSGGTAWAVSRHPVESILVVEISPEVIAASDRFFPEINHGVLADPRVGVEIHDGRNFLLASPRTFDAVLSDSIHPRYAGNGSLYTRDYFALLRARLRPGGVASMWLPTYGLVPRNYAMILQAFREVFPHTTVWYEPSALNGFTIVTGRLSETPWDGEALARAFADPQVAAELADLGIAGPADLLLCYVAGREELDLLLAGIPAHVDDLPAVEYESGLLLDRDRPWLATFTRLLAARPPAPPADYLVALTAEEQARARALWEARGRLLAAHRDDLARQLARKPRQR